MSTSARLDAFTDAAFAFAVTLMVVGAGSAPVDPDQLKTLAAAVPSFAIGFAIVAMFWFSHVQWRRYRGEGDWRSVLLSFGLIFVVLIYVTPLRAVAISFSAYLMGKPDAFRGNLRMLFTLYGVGFTVMAGLMAALFHDALRGEGDVANRRELSGILGIWLIQTATGALSTLIAQLPGGGAQIAPFLYATLPITVPLFSMLWRRKRTTAVVPDP